MSKAILVMGMPRMCIECPCLDNRCYCAANCKNVTRREKFEQKPSWCPLKECPEKKEFTYGGRVFGKSFTCGYNACIDEILGGGE